MSNILIVNNKFILKYNAAWWLLANKFVNLSKSQAQEMFIN